MAAQTDSQEVVLDVEGMTCASCVQKIERSLSQLEGVEDAVVNLATRTATVRTSSPDVGALISAVTHTGYGARPHTAERPAGEEYRTYRRRFIAAALLTIPVLALTFVVPDLPSAPELSWILSTPVVFWAGWPFFLAAVRAARHASTTMDTLIAIGSTAAYAYSLWALTSGEDELYFDTAAVIVTLILLGRTESRARAGATDAVRTLVERGAKEATLIENGRERTVPIEELKPGDLVMVRPGEKVPADGVVKVGTSWVDLSLLTGESFPVDVGPGADVVGASVNGHGRIVVFVTRTGGNSKLGEIVRLLQAAQASKAPIQRLADRISSVFVPVVISIAIVTFLGWTFVADALSGTAVLHGRPVDRMPVRAGAATPVAIIAGTGRAAELGVLFKGGEVFEAVRDADVVLLDKTGTVTEGRMTSQASWPSINLEDDVLALAAATEAGSEHPIARAVVQAATDRGVPLPEATDHAVQPGAGAAATIGGARVRIGRPEGLPPELDIQMRTVAGAGLTPFAVWRDEVPLGLVTVSDEVKPEAEGAVRRLEDLGLKVAMVTGDRRSTAEAIAAGVGIDRVAAEVLPEGKIDEVRRLQADGRRVIFVGDGLNDAPALAQADVGIAVGSGTDVALAAADVNLLGGALTAVPDALQLAGKTYRVIIQNLFWAFIYNVVMILLAVVGALTLMRAAAAMAGSSLSVVLNALRLRRFHRPGRPGVAIGRTEGRPCTESTTRAAET